MPNGFMLRAISNIGPGKDVFSIGTRAWTKSNLVLIALLRRGRGLGKDKARGPHRN
jgi:hypothetical protein